MLKKKKINAYDHLVEPSWFLVDLKREKKDSLD